jgi:Tol biopolymer transport system component
MAEEHVLQWGADGSLIFASEHDGWLHLYSIPGAGGKPILLTPGGCEVEHISYSADRSTIVYSSNCGDINRRHLWQVSVTGAPGS